MIVHITRATRHLLFWSLMATALALSVVRIFLADIDDYRLDLQQKIRQLTDIPILIGNLDAGMRGFNPEVILQDIRIEAVSADAKPPIQLREIRLGLNVLDLLLTRNWLSASRVTLVGANLSVTRQIDGSFSIKGLQASEGKPLWLLQGSQYEILDSQITWQDLKRHGQPVHFDRIDLVLKNHYFEKSHEVHLLSRLPYQYGDSLRISAQLKGDIFTGENIEGQLYLEGTDLQASALITGDLPLGLNLQSGAGDVRVWSLWRDSKPYHVVGYLQAQQIKISRQPGKTLALDTFQGHFTWSDQNGRWRLAAYDLNVLTNWQHWPDGAFFLQQDEQGNLSALIQQLDLPAAMYLAPLFLPAESNGFDLLALNPQGRLKDMRLFVAADRQHYAAQGHFDELGVNAWQALPKIQGISGEISLTDAYGQIMFDTRKAQVEAGDWFRSALAVEQIHGAIHWWQTPEAWQIYSPALTIDSADFATQTRFNLWLPKTIAAPIVDLQMDFGRFNDISQVSRYLPAKIMDPGAVAWLDDAFVAGQIKHGQLRLQGDLAQFPFKNGPGIFETVFAIEQGEIQFNEDWPHLQDVYADVQFLGADLQVAIWEGRSQKVDIDQAVVTIPALNDSERVYVWGQVHAKIMDSLRFLQSAPLKDKIAPLAKVIDAEGETQVNLDLNIPYAETEPVGVNVNARLQQAQLTVKPIALKVDEINGQLNFTADRITSSPLQARTLGYPLTGRLSSDEQATYLDMTGTTSIAMLVKQFAFLQNDAVKGQFNYDSRLTLPYQVTQPASLTINSRLLGLQIDEQTDFAKTATEEKPFRVNFQFESGPYLPLQLIYGDALKAHFLIETASEQLFSGHVVLGQGHASRYPQAGLKLEVRQPTFNLSRAVGEWQHSENQKHPPLREFMLDTDQLIWQGHDLGAVQGQGVYLQDHWQGQINSVMAKGRFSIPGQINTTSHIDLDMDYLNVSALDRFELQAADEGGVNELPLIDIDSRQLLWRGVDMGRLALQTERVLNGIHFKTVRLKGLHSDIDLTADWLKQPEGTLTQIKGRLQTDRFGDFLTGLGFTEDIKETSADISFKGGWQGGPHQFALDRLNGVLKLNLQEGRISSIEPGFGRLLGLVAMEQWVKRLSLNFSDMYRQGLAFDDIKGRFKIKDGLAFTDDLLVNAVAARFYLAGYVNLVDKTIDQRVAVVPKSSDAVPIAGTIVNSIAAVITQAVTNDYKEGYFLGSQYQLSGAWGNVSVTPLPEQDGLLNKTWRGLTDFGWIESIGE